MSNPWFTASGVPVAATRVQSAPVRGEFTSVGAGFDAAYAATILRGLKAGDTWTGTHDFSGATVTLGTTSFSVSPTVPTPGGTDNSTKAVNSSWVVTYVQGVAFSGALPNQTANADKFVTTNGTVASWSNLLKDGTIRWANSSDTTKLVVYDLSGITTATTRTVTMPNKSGTMAMTSDVFMTLLATVTPTVAANVDALSTFSSTYDNYLILIDGVKPAADDTLTLRLATGGSVDSGSNYYGSNVETASAVTVATSAITLASSATTAGKGICSAFHILNVNDATNLKVVGGKTAYQSAATPGFTLWGVNAVYTAANTVSGLRLYWGSGNNFSAVGKVRIYGYN
jgi:hypothetical protein